jgi:hypothetical protein
MMPVRADSRSRDRHRRRVRPSGCFDPPEEATGAHSAVSELVSSIWTGDGTSPPSGRTSVHHRVVQVSPLDVLAFAGELALMAALAVAATALADGVAAVVLALALIAALIAVWARWLAPRSSRRLTFPTRLVAKLVLVLAVGASLVAAGRPMTGVLVLLGVGVVFAGSEVADAGRGSDVRP